MRKPTLSDYPLCETNPDNICGPRVITLDKITLYTVIAGDIEIEGLRISSKALLAQSGIALAAGRKTLALNFQRGAELVNIPQDLIMQTYEMLRPGQINSRAALTAQAKLFQKATAHI